MKKSFRRGFLLGIGLVRLSAQKVEQEVKAFARENRLTKKEAETLAKEFLRKAEAERKKLIVDVKKESKTLEKRFRSEIARIKRK